MNKRKHFASFPFPAAIFGLQGQEIGTWRHTVGAFCPEGVHRKVGERKNRQRVCLSKTHQHVNFFSHSVKHEKSTAIVCFTKITSYTCL